MSSPSHHVICQQYLHVELNGTEADGFALQRSLPALYQDALLPAIERVLDRCGPVEGHLSIDRLEIDAGETTLERLEFAIAESVELAIEKAIREEMSHVQSQRTIPAVHVRLRTNGHSIAESFIYFLNTGSLPWSFRLAKGGSLEQTMLDLLRDRVKEGIDDQFTANAIRTALGSEASRKRLTLQFSPVLLEALLLMLAPESKTVLDKVLHSMSIVDDPTDKKQFERYLWETAIGGVAEGKALTSELLISETCRSLPESFVLAPALAERLESHWPGATRRDLIHTARSTRSDSVERGPEDPNSKRIRTNYPDTMRKRFTTSNAGPVQMNEHPDAKEGIYIWNAGVVLLHPFLPQLFSALGIASEDQLLQPGRALGLLHFLTTGELQVPEYELVLPKILCDFPLDASVESGMDLSETEKDEATALLNAVIRHWDALGDASPDALRGTFLLRPGKVSLRDDGDWLLQVESEGFDILLDQLPWGFSTIKLPWMKSMLWVEWNHQ